MYTPGVYLHRSVYCAYERGFRRIEYDKIREELEKEFFSVFVVFFLLSALSDIHTHPFPELRGILLYHTSKITFQCLSV